MFISNCRYCNKEIFRKKEVAISGLFCSNKCKNIYYYNDVFYEKRTCPICETVFPEKKKFSKVYCSIKCLNIWQKESGIHKGINNSNYNSSIPEDKRYLVCEWCNNIFYLKKIDTINKRRFCNEKCRREWYANIWSQSDEWKERKSKQMCDQRENLDFNISKPQLIVNSVCEYLSINIEIEKSFYKQTLDIFIPDKNIAIEIMGTFWHCDFRYYNNVAYENQKNRIRLDKIKKSYFNNLKIPILYIWENEINNDIKLVGELVEKFYSSGGILPNYHSFNYYFNGKKLILNKEIFVPYMERSIEEINILSTINLKNKMSKKQSDKWILFNCYQCGNIKEELISHYNKSENHFCSQKCSSNFRKKILSLND